MARHGSGPENAGMRGAAAALSVLLLLGACASSGGSAVADEAIAEPPDCPDIADPAAQPPGGPEARRDCPPPDEQIRRIEAPAPGIPGGEERLKRLKRQAEQGQ